MKYAVCMHQLKRIQQRRGNKIQFFLGWRTAQSSEPLFERPTLDEIEHHVSSRVGLEHAPNSDDIGMIQPRQETSFIVEPPKAPFEIALVFKACFPSITNCKAIREKLFEREILP
jgi:hypothetical protein